jgi:hypothetical protein
MIFRNLFVFLSLILITNAALAQKKVIRPKKGEIVFISEEIIKDKKLFTQSYNKMAKNMILALKEVFTKEKEQENSNLDTIMLNSALDTLDSVLPEMMANIKGKSEHHYLYKDSLIENYITANDILTGDFITIINPLKCTSYLKFKLERESNNSTFAEYQYSKTRDCSILEFREERKLINGYNCFKVIYKYKELNEDAGDDVATSEKEFLTFMSNFNYYKEFWVTEEIQSLFHPVCKDKEILTKFYPLEIREYNDLIKGIEHIYTLKSISLSN